METKFLIKKNTILYICLFIIVLAESIQKIYFFSQSKIFLSVTSDITLFADLILIFFCFTKTYNIREFCAIFIIGALLLIGYFYSKMSAYLTGFILLVACKNVDIYKLLKTIRYGISFTVIISVILYISGVSNAGLARRGYSGFGFVHPNMAALMFMLCVLLWVAENNELSLLKLSFILSISGIIILILTGSRTVLITILSLLILLPIVKQNFNRNKENWMISSLKYIQPIILLFTYISAKYLSNIVFFQVLDKLSVNRIFLNYFALNKFGIYLFGQDSDLQTLGTVFNNISNVYWTTGATVDSAYMTSLLVMGLVPTIVWSCSYVIMMKKVAKTRNYVFFCLAVVLCFEAFMETGMLAIYCNFAFFFLTAKLYPLASKGDKRSE